MVTQPTVLVPTPGTAALLPAQPDAAVLTPVIAPERSEGQDGTNGKSDVSVVSFAGIAAGDYQCRLADLPLNLPNYEFRCRASQKLRGVIQLVSLDADETSLVLGVQADRAVSVSGQIFIPGRKLAREYEQRWVKLFGKLKPVAPNHGLVSGQVKALVQSYGQWAAPQVDGATRKPAPRGTPAEVRFELLSKLEGFKN